MHLGPTPARDNLDVSTRFDLAAQDKSFLEHSSAWRQLFPQLRRVQIKKNVTAVLLLDNMARINSATPKRADVLGKDNRLENAQRT